MMRFTRREFVSRLTLAGAAGLLNMRPETASAEPPPETTKIRPTQIPDPCSGTPLIVADDLLRAEGFTDVRYSRPTGVDGVAAVVAGEADIGIAAVFGLIPRLDAGDPC
jgi:NitT/TauT family transport system substrate-binding protein